MDTLVSYLGLTIAAVPSADTFLLGQVLAVSLTSRSCYQLQAYLTGQEKVGLPRAQNLLPWQKDSAMCGSGDAGSWGWGASDPACPR